MDKMTLMQAALRYLELGLPVIPLKKDKKPYIKWEKYQKELPAPDQVVRWWERWPNANIGIPTGVLSGLFVLDFDSPDALTAWEASFEELPPGLMYTTGKGKQYWFKFSGYDQGNKSKIMGEVDIRGEGGYVMVPPSIHPNGKTYTWGNINALDHGLDELDDMPKEMLKFCTAASKTPDLSAPASPVRAANMPGPASGQRTSKELAELTKGPNTLDWVQEILLNGAKEGNRNARATRLVGFYVRYHADHGFSKEDMLEPIFNILKDWNLRVVHPPLPEEELYTICRSIIGRHSFEKISEAIGSPIYDIVRYNRQIGDPIYKIYTENGELRCTMTELCNLNLFRPKYAILTDIVITTIKSKDWYAMIQACLKEKTIENEALEESALSILTNWIQSTAEKNGSEKTKLKNGPIVLEGIVRITTDAATRFLQTTNLRKSDWDNVRDMLKTIGFEWDSKSKIRVGQKTFKTWRMSLIELNNLVKVDHEELEEKE